tara:strand:- start:31 stop:1491 length:1461 start_codon:yes stop_codon:yes gene_type:complete
MEFIWITGGDKGYLDMIEVLAKSLLKYSKHKLIVYGFNCDSNINLPNVINRRIDFTRFKRDSNNSEVDLKDKDYSIYFAKYLASLDSLNLDYNKYAWIDGDAFVTEHIDKSLKYIDGLEDYPLFMRYFHQNINNWRVINNIRLEGHYGSELASIKNIDRNPNNRIIATGFYFYDSKSIPFFEKCLEWDEGLSNHSIKIWVDDNAFSEERVANCILWEEGKDKYLPITWNNFYSPNEDLKVKNRYYLEKGWDNMFDEATNEVLFIHGPDPSVTPKNAKILNEAFNDYQSTKLMIIAHPDDELIFGGVELINSGSDYKVVCVANPTNKDRILEFEAVMKKLNICSWEILDYEDTLHPTQTYDKLDDIINSREWEKIVTHNPVGEYGHPQHKLIHDRVKNCLAETSSGIINNFYVFGKSPNKIEENILNTKLELLKLYKSEEEIINQILNSNGRWFISNDLTTNYIEYENISKYNIKQDNTPYIHCYDK